MEKNLHSQFVELTNHVGLKKNEAHNFLDGISSKIQSASSLSLDRKKYTAMQTGVERILLGTHTEREESSLPPFIYHTPKPVTPSYDEKHPRFSLLREMVQKDLALFLFSYQAFAQLLASLIEDKKFNEIELLKGFLRDLPANRFSVSKESKESYMVYQSENDDLNSMAFEAHQQPSEDFGSIFFKDYAHEKYTLALLDHAKNTLIGESRELIFSTLKLTDK